jgi:hypothetical protein
MTAGRHTPALTVAAERQKRFGFVRSDRLARAALLVLVGLLAWHTWARWGDLQIDCGREVYVPIAILHGKVLYRDLYYPFGPLAPYLQALLLLIFGVHLNVLYAFGVGLAAIGALLLFAIVVRLMPVLGAFIVSYTYLIRGFGPFIFNLCLPYSYATELGSQLGFACVYFLVRDALDESGRNLLWAGAAAGLALTAKQEFGIASYIVIAAAMAWRLIRMRNFSVVAIHSLALLPGMIIAAATYGWFMWRFSPSFILAENFQFGPGAYFMRAYGAVWLSKVGFRFIPAEIAWLLAGAAFSFGAWYLIPLALRAATQRPLTVVCCGAGAVLAGVLAHYYFALPSLTELSGLIVFPRGIYAFGIVALAGAIAGYPRDLGEAGRSALIVVAIYALAIGVRVYAADGLWGYPIYYDALVFALFIFVITRAAATGARDTETRWRRSIPSALLAVEGVAIFIFSYPAWLPPVLLQTPIGNIYTGGIEAHQIPRIVAFMQQESGARRHVLLLPEAPMLYAFAGSESPTRWYFLTPGVISPDEEREFINQAESYGVDYVLLSNRVFPEYGATYFGRSYCQIVYGWILNNYRLVGQFGRFRPGGYFAMQVYEKRGQNPSNQEQSMFDRLDGYSRRMAEQYEALRSSRDPSRPDRATDQ